MLLMTAYSEKKTEYTNQKYIRSIINELKKYGYAFVELNKNVKSTILEEYPKATFIQYESYCEVKILGGNMNNQNQLGFNFDEPTAGLETLEEKKLKEKEAKEAAKKAEQELTTARNGLIYKLEELVKFEKGNASEDDDEEESENEEDDNDYQAILDKVGTMSLEEIAAVEEQIKLAYDRMLELKKEAQKQRQLAKETKEKAKKQIETKKYKYPFIIHMAGKNIETDHIFENEKDYTSEEIRTKMLEHQYYDFSGKVEFEYLEKDNILLPIFQHHRKG